MPQIRRVEDEPKAWAMTMTEQPAVPIRFRARAIEPSGRLADVCRLTGAQGICTRVEPAAAVLGNSSRMDAWIASATAAAIRSDPMSLKWIGSPKA